MRFMGMLGILTSNNLVGVKNRLISWSFVEVQISPLSMIAARYSCLVRFDLFGLFFWEKRSLSNCSRAAFSAVLLESAVGSNPISSVSWIVFKSVRSLERVWPSLAWQEREASEMLGLTFVAKRDQRSLFLLPLGVNAPLRRGSPTGGLYELRLDELGNSFSLARRG